MKKQGITVVTLKEVIFDFCWPKKNFFKQITQKFETEEERVDYLKKYDFDSPEAIDWDLFEKAIHSLINKKPFNTPIYDIHSEKRLTVTNKLSPKDMIVVEGRLFFNYATIRDKLDFKLF